MNDGQQGQPDEQKLEFGFHKKLWVKFFLTSMIFYSTVLFLRLDRGKCKLKMQEYSFVTIKLIAVKSNPTGDNGKN